MYVETVQEGTMIYSLRTHNFIHSKILYIPREKHMTDFSLNQLDI
jgi:hypothetical protein